MPTSVQAVSLLERLGQGRPWSAAALAEHGSDLAVVDGSHTLGYADLAGRVDDLAGALGTDRRLVLVAGGNRLDALVAYLAALSGGHAVLLAPPGQGAPADRLVAAFDPDVVLSDRSGWALEERRAGSRHRLHPELALLLSTSGSTGSPRLVRLSHRNLEANAHAIGEYLRLSPADRAITSLPMHYCYGLSVINSHLAAGAGVVLTETSVVDACFWRAVHDHAVTGIAGVPHTFDLLDRVGFASMAVPSLRYLTQAGGRLAPDRVRRYAALGQRDGWELFVMYGQTEATARMAYLPPGLAATRPSAIGIPIPGGSFELEPVDEADPGVGELVYRGDNVMLGYADRPADLSRGACLDRLRTGDLARRDADGLYEIVGRRSRFAKLFGLRLDLDHLEALLDAAGVAALCASDDEHLVVGVTSPQHAAVAEASVREETGLPPSRLAVVTVPELPRLANGKPDHVALLRAAAAEVAAPAEPVPVADIDPRVLRAFVEVLQRRDLTAASTFVSLGGDSLSYVEMSIALEGVLGTLPAQWHTTPLGELRPATVARARARRVETSVVLRAVAIVLVVGTHIKLFDVLGGAHLLLGIAGFNYARFRGSTADRVRSLARIAVPSALWLALASTINDRIELPHVLLVHGWFGDPRAHGGYWYVEAVVQILVPLAGLLAIPAVARLDRARPAAVPLAVLAAGLLVRFDVLALPTVEPHDIRPHDILWLFALGWAAGAVRAPRSRAAIAAVALVAVPGYFGEPAREALVVAGLLLLFFVPSVPLPRWLTPVVGHVAAASLYIYLTHWQVFPPLRDAHGPVVALGGSLLAGVALWTAVRAGTNLARRARRQGVGEGASALTASAPA